MEIVSIPLKGLLAHGDSKKHSRTITVGDIQVMSAGTGIYHSEMNGSKSEPVEFLQIWIIPKERNTHPLYQDYDIRGLLKKDELAFILSPDGSTPAKLLQDTWFSMGEIGAGKTVEYTLHGTDMGVYVFLIEGEVKIDDVILTRRDGLGISEIKNFEIETLKDSKILQPAFSFQPMAPRSYRCTGRRTYCHAGRHRISRRATIDPYRTAKGSA